MDEQKVREQLTQPFVFVHEKQEAIESWQYLSGQLIREALIALFMPSYNMYGILQGIIFYRNQIRADLQCAVTFSSLHHTHLLEAATVCVCVFG